MCKKNNVIKALVAGGIVGGVLGVLFAPKSGKETREDIVKGYNKAHKEIGKKVDEMISVPYTQYASIVQTIVDKYAQVKDLSLEQAQILKEKLMEEWESIEEERKDIANKKKGVK